MFRKLRIKFIGIATLSMMIVLFIVLGLVNFLTYRNAVSEIYTTLDFISKHSGTKLSEDEIEAFKNKDITPETQYETRYITVMVDDKGNLQSFDAEHIAAIDDNEIEEFIDYATENKRYRGIFIYDGLTYAYQKVKVENLIKITIIDCTRNMSTANFFMRFSLDIGAISILVILLVLSIFARRVVRPYVKNAEAQKQFITNASHELKTPLAVISANMEVIEMMDGKSEWTESTINQVNRMSDLISQLVVLSKLEERDDLVLTDVNISEQAEKSVANYKTVAETKGLHFDYNLEKDVHVSADEKGIYELVNILLDNAIKYCDENGNISISLLKKGKNAVLTVSNDYKNGEGVDYNRFFERFYREDKSHNSTKQGYGIGLSMAESLVSMFKGKISVSYKKPVISFNVTLN